MIPLMACEAEAESWNHPGRALGLEPTGRRTNSDCQQLSLAGVRDGAEVEETRHMERDEDREVQIEA